MLRRYDGCVLHFVQILKELPMSTIEKISSGPLSAAIDSQGAQLMSLALDGTEYLWQRDPKWWPRCAPILFPIVGVLRNGFATSEQGDIHLSRHGLARNMEHSVAKKDDSSVTLHVESTDETKKSFPYDWVLEMTYAVDGEKLSQAYTVKNPGKVTLPFTLGGHPAFNLPVAGTDESFENYELRFAAPWDIETAAIDTEGLEDFSQMSSLGTSDTLPLTHGLFERYLTLTLHDVPENRVQLFGKKSGHGVELSFDGFPYLGVWSAENDAPFVAVEPWVGVAAAKDETDEFEKKRGMLFLEPGEELSRTFTIRPF